MKRFEVRCKDLWGRHAYWVQAWSRKEAVDFIKGQYREPLEIEALDLDDEKELARSIFARDVFPKGDAEKGPPKFLMSGMDSRTVIVEMKADGAENTQLLSFRVAEENKAPEPVLEPEVRVARTGPGRKKGSKNKVKRTPKTAGVKLGRPRGSLNKKTIERLKREAEERAASENATGEQTVQVPPPTDLKVKVRKVE